MQYGSAPRNRLDLYLPSGCEFDEEKTEAAVRAAPEPMKLDVVFEDADLLVVNKHCGDLVQPDPSGQSALEDQIKAFIKHRDAKPGEVFLGVVHRIDRPVSGVVLFAKTSKALSRLNEMIREGRIQKIYWVKP